MAVSKSKRFRSIVAGVIIGLILVNGWVLYTTFEKVSAQEIWVQHTSQVMNELELVVSSVKDTETGIRGYLLTRKKEFLEPHRQGELEIVEHFNKFRSLTEDNPSQQAAAGVLDDLIKARLVSLNELKEASEKGNLSQDRQFQFLSNGKAVMDQLRSQVSKMAANQNQLLGERTREAEKSRDFFIWSVIMTTLVSGVAVAVAFFQFRKHQDKLEIEAEEQRKEVWIKEASAEIARLTAGNVGLKASAREVSRVLAERFGFLASRTFLMEAGGLKQIANAGCETETEVGFEKGLLAEAASKTKVWQVNEVPASHWMIKTGLGESLPHSLIFIPLRFQGGVVGVIECASFTSLDGEKLRALDRVSETIGIGYNAGRSREQLQELLEKTQQQSEELQTQQEELRTNNEELEQQTRALESQQQSLNLQNRELEAIRFDLEAKAEELTSSSQYKSEFLAKMSHELRTPLNGLLILSTLLIENKEKNLSERQIQFAKSIYGAGNDLLTLVNDILDLSKIEARKLSLRPESFKLQELLEHKRVTFAPQIEEKNLKFNVDIDNDLKKMALMTDRQRLEQILRNFISNAIKFTDRGEITIKAKSSVGDATKIDISVTDTGIGIPADKQKLVFEAFEQADGSISRNFGGTGLGLTISKELAFLLGGHISLESVEGLGSTFTLTVPITLPQGTEARAAIRPIAKDRSAGKEPVQYERKVGPAVVSEAQDIIAKIPASSKTILIVEDDERFRSSVKDAVKEYDFYAIEAGDGEVALAILENFTPDAVLLDIKLPGISGLGILEMMKQMPQLRHVPVHMISAMDYQHNALRRGALGYLTKPVTLEKVRSAVSRIQNFLDEKIRKVLVIEDDPTQRSAIASLISGTDVSVVTSKSGKEAVESLKKEPFDCIILDLTLPDVSGFDLLTELNSLPISLPPIVIYTGKDLTDDEEEYLRKFSESIIIKGARSPERLLDEVNLFLHRIESLLPAEKRAMLTQLRSQEQSFAGKSVLIADDDLRNVFALTSALESKGLKVIIAKNGIEAIEALEKNKNIDLVLMDIMMPKMDGYEAMRNIRKNPDTRVKNTPMIALTAKAMRDDHEKCIEAGANDYLPKPVVLDNLVTAMKVWLTPREGF